MNLFPAQTSLGHQLFGGLFDQPQSGATGLFSLAMALFAQSGAESGVTGQLAPAVQGTQTPLHLPTVFALPENSADPAAAALTQPVSWLPLLQNLAGDQPLSPELKAFLGENPLTLQELQTKLEGLDEDDQQALLGEIAALIAPHVAQPLAPVTTPSETDHLAIDAASGKPQEAKSELPVLPQQNLSGGNSLQADENPENTAPDSALGQLTRLLQNHQENGDTSPVLPEKLLVRATEPEEAPATADDTVAAADENAPDQTKTPPARKEEKADLAVAAPSSQATDTQRTDKPAGQDSSPRLATIGETDRSGSDTNSSHSGAGDDASGASSAPGTAQTAAPKETNASSFAEQLARMNRHGTHVPVSEQVSVQLTRALQDGQDRMTIRLHPAELGRIEVKLDMAADGRISASFSVDQPATLDLLQRDQKGLERALSDAGLKPDSSSLSFNLRGDGQGQSQQQAQTNTGNGNNQNQPGFSLDGMPAEDASAGQIEMTWFVNPDRLDVRV
jgi:flagellar hook-length control protein FliK